MLPTPSHDEFAKETAASSTEPEPHVLRVRYRRGEVGESHRSVHLVLERSDGLLASACGQTFTPSRMEQAQGGMPCMTCAQRAALSAQGMSTSALLDEHGTKGLPS